MAADNSPILRDDVDLQSWIFGIAERRMLGLFCLASFILHLLLVFWFSSRTPDLQRLDNDQFEVGLVSSEGLGEALQASLPATLEAETITPELVTSSTAVTDTQALENVQDTLPELEVVETIAPVALEVPSPDAATPVITPFIERPTPAQSEPEIDAVQRLSTVETVTPLAVAELIAPEASAPENLIESDVVSTIQAVPDVAPIDDFFQPAEILAPGDPITTLPIENVRQISEPEILLVDVDPELVKDDVEILEIKARDVFPAAPKPRVTTQARPTTAARNEGQGNNPATPNQAGRQLGETKTPQLAAQAVTPSVPPPVPKTYILELRKWLNNFKEYPIQAYRQKQEGVVIVGLVINRAGEILSHSIKRSAGHTILDEEVSKMVARAGKMPALPADYPRDQIELLIPVRFKVSK